MDRFTYILCHGSGNRFVLLDAIAVDVESIISVEFIQNLCRNCSSDGLLLLTRHDEEHLAMRMFNTDGSEAEMCGNGIRCVARLADSLYINRPSFVLYSGGKPYNICRESEVQAGVATYGVEIPIATASPDFTPSSTSFVGKVIEELDEELKFTYLNLGNPHIVALCPEVDYERLTAIGERVKNLKEIFPNGVNVSFVERRSSQQIFVATYERGVGLTASCGTAMTASSTAVVMQGLVAEGQEIDVRNRGGAVRCCCTLEPSIVTRLVGNASFVGRGVISREGEILSFEETRTEIDAWESLLQRINR